MGEQTPKLREVVPDDGSSLAAEHTTERQERLAHIDATHPDPVGPDSPLEDLGKAIAHQHKRLSCIDTDHPDRAYILDQESVIWYWKYIQTKEKSDIGQAIRASRSAVHTMRNDDIDKGTIYSHLSLWLRHRYIQTGSPKDRYDAFANGQLALDSLKRGSERWWTVHNNIGILWVDTTTQSPKIDLLNEGLKFHEDALEMLKPGHKLMSKYLARLCQLLAARHSKNDLSRAIELGYRAVEELEFAEKVDLEYDVLSCALFVNFQVDNLFSSLEEALRLSRIGLDMGDLRPAAFCNIGCMLEAKCQYYRETNPVEALRCVDEAIENGNRAIDPQNEYHFLYPHFLNMMGAWHATKMKLIEDLEIGDKGADMAERAARLRGRSHPDYPLIMGNLTHIREVQYQILLSRGQSAQALEFLIKAIEHGRDAVNTTDDKDPHLGERRFNLGKMLLSKYLRTQNDEPYAEAWKYMTLAAETETAPLLVRIPATMQAGLSCWNEDEIEEANRLLQSAVSLLPTLNENFISTQDLQQTLSQVSGLAGFAASIALEAGHSPFEALQSLETARCIISGVTISSRTDISELRKINSNLANRYENLRVSLADVSRELQRPGAYRGARKRQQDLLKEQAAAEASIRNIPGWELFQLPMTEQGFMDLASNGPVIVVNATKIRCDAIVVTINGIHLVELHDMKYEDLERSTTMFSELGNEARRNVKVKVKKLPDSPASDALLWLWNVAVQPILDNIELTSSKRVWWITTGLAGRAPFHAAGDHSLGSTRNTHSRVVSSYISSFKALRFARNKKWKSSQDQKMLLVTMSSNPPPHHDLNTLHEEDVTKQIFGPSMTHLPQPYPSIVLDHLPTHLVVHFACHGASIAYDPSQSGLLLIQDNKPAMLTISALEHVDLKEGAIAYLSACSTAEQPDGKLADEAIHLANSFQAAGFQHVIGTMWGAEDRAAGEVAKSFYERLFVEREDGGNGGLDVAGALHYATRKYMEDMGGNAVSWGMFIHIGS
jgi:tetratricopeptide (TPR) repeat protein